MRTRLALLPELFAVMLALPGAIYAEVPADSLLSVDQNRIEIVESLVVKRKDLLAASKDKELRQTLMSLRADKLLALSLAQDQKQFAALLEKDEFLPASAHSGRGKALGEFDKDVVYTPVTPCRILDTRNTLAITAGDQRDFIGTSEGTFGAQGGLATGNCGVPKAAVAIQANIVAVLPDAPGFLTVWPFGQPRPLASTLNYAANDIRANAVTIPLTKGQPWEFSVYALQTVNVLVDVLGYFAAPATGNGLRVVQTFGVYTDAPNVLNGSANNGASGQGATVAGGGLAGDTCYDPPTARFIRPGGNRVLGGDFATIGGGFANAASGTASTVAGGDDNTATGFASTVAGGDANIASSDYTTVAGGQRNIANRGKSTVSGGTSNTASGEASTVAGGGGNTANGQASTVAGGSGNTASGDYSFVAGAGGVARSTGMFVWSDSRRVKFDPVAQGAFGASVADPTPANNTFIVRATGGVDFVTGIDPLTGNTTTECFIVSGGAGWTCSSDRALKEAIQEVSPKSVLARLMRMPVSIWSIKGEKRRQMGPMAQDFYQAFGLGDTDKAINSIDAQGVAFAAIQGLHQVVKEKDAKINAQANELASLKRKLEAIEKKLGL